jgi:hypothetical protein
MVEMNARLQVEFRLLASKPLGAPHLKSAPSRERQRDHNGQACQNR